MDEIEIIVRLIFCLVWLDIFMTTWLLYEARKFKDDWWSYEANPPIRYLFRKYGLWKGAVIAFISALTYVSIVILALLWAKQNDAIYIILGMYSLITYIHLINLSYLKRMIKYKKILTELKIRQVVF